MNRLSIYISAVLSILIVSGVLLAQSDPLPPGKQAIEQQYTEERAAGTQNPAPKDPQAPYPIVPEQPFQTGIIDDCSPPFSSQSVNIVSCWQGMQNGTKTLVYTGAEAESFDPQQGIVYIMTIPDYPAETSAQTILAPVRDGAVRIVAAQDDGLMILVSITGADVLTLNVSTGAFTSQPPPPRLLAAALINVVQNFGLPVGISQDLLVKLNAAAAFLAQGNKIAAKWQLTAFLNAVSVQRGKGLTTAQADTLTTLARKAIAAL